MQSCIAHPGRHSGITLIEVLIALVLLGLVTTVLFTGLDLSARYWRSSESRIAATDRMRIVSGFLHREISETFPLFWQHGRNRELVFHGTDEALRFIGTLPAHRGGGGLHVLTLRREPTDTSGQLVLFYRLLGTGNGPLEDVTEDDEKKVLLDDLKELEFSYYGAVQEADAPEWHDVWDSDEALPQLMKIHLGVGSPAMHWPDIIVPIRAQANPRLAQTMSREDPALTTGAQDTAEPEA